MTKKELSQLYYLKKETFELQRRIMELETLATNGTAKITGLPHSGIISDKVGKNASKIADLKIKLEENFKKCVTELDRITNFINSIENSQIRLMLTFRYIQCFSWQKIAFKLDYYDESVPRKRHNYFLKKLKS